MIRLLLINLFIIAHTFAAAPQQENIIQKQPASWNDASLLSAAAVPKRKQLFIAPVVKGKIALAYDRASATILFEKNANTPAPIASITKLMTAIIILENHKLDEVVTVGANPPQALGSKIWLAQGETMKIENLLYGLLIPSGNDAAVALSEYHAGTERNFVQQMNEKGILLGLKQTKFVNSTGLDQKESNLSTAYEVALLSSYALRHDFIRKTAQIKTMEIRGENFGVHKIESTNKLLGSELPMKGLKTGSTMLAGPSFVGLMDTPTATDLITVILNSEERFTDTKKLIYWVNRAYVW